MDNYKIKVKDEAESKEAQELFFELGFQHRWDGAVLKKSWSTARLVYVENGILWSGNCSDDFHECEFQELTLPQLRDLVVLKRNDINNATHTCENDFKYICIDERWHLMTTDGWFHVSVNPKALKPINQPQDPALISGAEALRALADGKDVDVHESTYKNEVWFNLKDTKFTPAEILAEKVRDKPYTLTFRLKPQTIKVELEIPAPYKAKIGGRDDTSFVLNVGRHQYLYQNEDDYTKARDALEAVFDSAVRGTNS
ncbi:hypothetical protein ABFO98_17610 [Acinetobacter baumannii]